MHHVPIHVVVRSIGDLTIMFSNVAMVSPESLGKVLNIWSMVDVEVRKKVARGLSALCTTFEAVQEM